MKFYDADLSAAQQDPLINIKALIMFCYRFNIHSPIKYELFCTSIKCAAYLHQTSNKVRAYLGLSGNEALPELGEAAIGHHGESGVDLLWDRVTAPSQSHC